MAYIDGTGLRQRFGEQEIDDLIGADNDADPTPIEGDTEKLGRACEDATTLIDGYLASRYSLPLVSVPSIVTNWAADIARFKLWDDEAPKEVRARYDDALAQLAELSKGRIALPPGADGTPAAPPLAFGGYSNDRVFTADTLCGY